MESQGNACGGAFHVDSRVKAVIDLMQQSIRAQLSIGALSRSVNLSPTRLRQLFNTETGLSPMRYLRGLRMKHAEQLLRTTFLSVKEVAFVSGMNDSQ